MTDTEELKFEIKSGNDYVRIFAIGLTYPNAETDWEKNYIESRIEINAYPFNGIYKATLFAVDFEKFKQGLDRIYNDLSGVTLFDCLENDIEIKVKGDGLGHFSASCKAKDTTTQGGNELSFNLNFDQTQIPELINQLEEITKAFPTVGNIKYSKTTITVKNQTGGNTNE